MSRTGRRSLRPCRLLHAIGYAEPLTQYSLTRNRVASGIRCKSAGVVPASWSG